MSNNPHPPQAGPGYGPPPGQYPAPGPHPAGPPQHQPPTGPPQHQPSGPPGPPVPGQGQAAAGGFQPPAREAAPQSAARQSLNALRDEVGKAVVGQSSAVTAMIIGLLCRGHILLEGVPGTAKTLLVRSFCEALQLDTKRIQFTPDLMPGDITGSQIYDARTGEFTFRKGPVFTNLMLADEINRTPPKSQAALLEAMEERQVSVDGEAMPLPTPFMVAATQNPVEFEGTYPLPEAQLDRFLMKIRIDLPERDTEIEVLRRHAGGFDPRNLSAAGLRPVASPDDLAAAQSELADTLVQPQIMAYIVDVVRATRMSPSLQIGVSPRGATAILNTAKAWAWLQGRAYVSPDDVKALAFPTLRHRVTLRPEAEMDGISTDSVIESILATVPVPR
ncbi:AAA family ATPase [Propionibacteriaceae bacterium Y2011]|uniref:AAA family ATPase n=1 Tax=Microlunatus sp. Y2014 TaxID=3418488 RepID=UPI003B44C091